MLWFRKGFNADPHPDPNPAFYHNADPDPDPDPVRQTNTDPESVQTLKSQNLNFYMEKIGT
jgi:hypothetical protein